MRYKTKLTVSLDLLAQNYAKLKVRSPKNKTIFMVKAGGYGHGMLPVADFAASELQIEEFGVATLGEGIALRRNFADKLTTIYVFSDSELYHPKSKEAFLEQGLLPVIHSWEDLQLILDDKDYQRLPLVIKIDTGMNRLGIDHEKVGELITLLKSKRRNHIHHLLSHFSTSFFPAETHHRTQVQIERFTAVKKALQENGISFEFSSISNSGAIEQSLGLEETHIRPGIMLYGPASVEGEFKGDIWDGKIISTLETHLLQFRPIKKGTPVGYGGHICPQDGILGVMALGYGDGIGTHYGGVKFLVEDFTVSILGRVNMDMAALLFPMEALNKLSRDSKIKLWDHNPSSITNLTSQMKRIPYELFCSLSSRVPRVYTLN